MAPIALGANSECTWYSYENLTLRRRNVLHVLDADGSGDGQIQWQKKNSTLAWQGFFRLLDDDTTAYAFDAYGRGVMKCAKLYNMEDGIFEGTDYDGRLVRITKLRTLQYCTRRKAWRPMPD